MKSNSQNCIRTLFNLPNEEKIYDDFGCAYSKQILFHGRLFLTENFICFNSNIIGLKTKLILSLKDIKEIKRKKTLGIFNNTIEIILGQNNKIQSYIFTSFNSRNIAYRRIKMVTQNYQRQFNINNKDVCVSDSEDDEQELVDLHNKSSDLYSINTEIETGTKENEVYFPKIDEENRFEVIKIKINLSSDEFVNRFFINPASEDEKGILEISYYNYLKQCGHQNIKFSDWKELDKLKDDNSSNANVKIREINMVIKVSGVPFLSETRIHKVQKMVKEVDHKYSMVANNHSLDVPYGSFFNVEELWEIQAIEENKCVIRLTGSVIFAKSTMFKSKIEKKTREEMKKEGDIWLEFIKNKGVNWETYIQKDHKKKNSILNQDMMLLHGVEKTFDINMLPRHRQFLIFMTNFSLEFCERNKKTISLFVILTLILLLVFLCYLKLLTINYDNNQNSLKLDRLIREIQYNNVMCFKRNDQE